MTDDDIWAPLAAFGVAPICVAFMMIFPHNGASPTPWGLVVLGFFSCWVWICSGLSLNKSVMQTLKIREDQLQKDRELSDHVLRKIIQEEIRKGVK